MKEAIITPVTTSPTADYEESTLTKPSSARQARPPPPVTRGRCSRPPRAGRHMVVHRAGVYIGDSVNYVCDTDYKFAEGGSQRTVVCRDDGTWSDAVGDCQLITCPAVPTVLNAKAKGRDVHIGAAVVYTCKNGMLFPNGINWAEIRCIGRGEWHPPLASCKANRCPPLPYVDNTIVVDKYTSDVNSTATFVCQPGSYFKDGSNTKSIACRPDLEWEHIEECTVTRCDTLQTPRNGNKSSNAVEYNVIVEVHCNKGYSFQDRTTTVVVQCLDNSRWNWTESNCSAISCPRHPEVLNATKSGDGNRFGDVIRYKCKSGERFNDGTTSKWIKCTESTAWNDSVSDCASGRCPPLPSIPGAKPARYLAVNGTMTAYRCKPGKVFPDRSATLLAYCDGTAWNVTKTACKPLHCKEVGPSDHWTVNSTDTVYGSVVLYSCHSGYTFDAGRSVKTRCNETGLWSHEPGQCRLVDCGPPPVVFYSVRDTSIVTTYGSSVKITCLSGFWLRNGVFSATFRCSDQATWQPAAGHCMVVKCRAFAKWNGVIANTTQRVAGTKVNVTCGDARMFPDSLPYKVATCGDQGVWTPAVPDCVDRVAPAKFVAPIREGTRAQVIGAAAIGLVVAVVLAVVAADVTNLKDALRRLNRNIDRLRQRH
ncbi:Sushi, von Willebrand factor type A, EGF and pentraxin domain-containing protein 1 [Lamellibrachia satsuma]|nr:Sushi, von Willebrand factor type A, EGF and pentraxin domain-containing protein 1 [Lamellibrachia satsuma]